MRKSLYRLKALSDAIWGAEIELFFCALLPARTYGPSDRFLEPEKPVFRRTLMELGRQEEQS